MFLLSPPGSQASKDSWSAYESGHQDFLAARAAMNGLDLDASERGTLTEVDRQFAAYVGFVQRMQTALAAGDRDTAIAAQTVDNNDASNAMTARLDQFGDTQREHMQARMDDLLGLLETSRRLTLVLAATATVVGIGVALVLARSISGALRLVSEAAARIAGEDMPSFVRVARALADGDLTQDVVVTAQPVPLSGKDDIGRMAADFNVMIEELQGRGSSDGRHDRFAARGGRSDAQRGLCAGRRRHPARSHLRTDRHGRVPGGGPRARGRRGISVHALQCGQHAPCHRPAHPGHRRYCARRRRPGQPGAGQ
jgi:hypothetical protein